MGQFLTDMAAQLLISSLSDSSSTLVLKLKTDLSYTVLSQADHLIDCKGTAPVQRRVVIHPSQFKLQTTMVNWLKLCLEAIAVLPTDYEKILNLKLISFP